jgi:hypothetical protein
MNNKEKRIAIQKILFPDSPKEWDSVFGPRTDAGLTTVRFNDDAPPPAGQLLVGDGTWPWINARLEGDDIFIEGAIVTAFGGASDSMDSGETASGLSTKDNPSYVGCALPMRRDSNVQLRGSPIPKVPWKTPVIFTDPKTKISVETKLIDEGPAKWTKHGGDMTVAAAKVFDPHATANSFTKTLDIRIIGGANYV